MSNNLGESRMWLTLVTFSLGPGELAPISVQGIKGRQRWDDEGYVRPLLAPDPCIKAKQKRFQWKTPKRGHRVLTRSATPV